MRSGRHRGVVHGPDIGDGVGRADQIDLADINIGPPALLSGSALWPRGCPGAALPSSQRNCMSRARLRGEMVGASRDWHGRRCKAWGTVGVVRVQRKKKARACDCTSTASTPCLYSFDGRILATTLSMSAYCLYSSRAACRECMRLHRQCLFLSGSAAAHSPGWPSRCSA